jgi:Outer membrane protein beta-barrel domain
MQLNGRPAFRACRMIPVFLAWGGNAAAAPDCPPDEWFCEESPETEQPDETPDAPAPPDDESGAPAAGVSGVANQADTARHPSSAVGAEPLGSDVPSDTGAWSVNLRLQGLLLGNRRHDADTRLGGFGASLRYRLSPFVTLDAGLDAIVGRDYAGRQRREGLLSLSSLLYFNPGQAVQIYASVGLNASAARVDVTGDDQSWFYFGGHTGIGLDIPVGRATSINVALLGFVRGRTDQSAAREPEFTDDSGRVTNTSGGCLFQAGVSLYW